MQSIKDLQGLKGTTERQARLTINRNNRVRDYLNKTARSIINWCLERKIGSVIVGVNPGMKQNINIGSCNNQNFVQIPHWSLRSKLKSLCERYGLIYQEQEESYTSKASFLDGDSIPTYNPDNPQEHQFSGKRVKRGLYRTQNGHLAVHLEAIAPHPLMAMNPGIAFLDNAFLINMAMQMATQDNVFVVCCLPSHPAHILGRSDADSIPKHLDRLRGGNLRSSFVLR